MSLEVDDTLSLPIILAWFRVNWAKIVLGGVVCALLSIPVTLFKNKTYESAATLLVSPPTFKDRRVQNEASISRDPADRVNRGIAEMMPRALPVEAYKAIALSAPLLDEVLRKVPLEIGITVLQDLLEVELVKMGGRGTSSGLIYTRALMFHAKADSPELAAKTANTWAMVFKEKVDKVAADGIKGASAILAKLHKDTKDELEEADLAIAKHRKDWNLELINAQLNAKQGQFTGFEGTLKQTEVDLASGEMNLQALETEFRKEPQRYVYFRSPSSTAYHIVAGLQNGGEPKIKPDDGLHTEEPNANYVQFRALVVAAKARVEGLKAAKDTFLLKLSELRDEMEALTNTYSDRTVERYKLIRKSTGLKSTYSVVRADYEKGRMANQTQASDIVIAGEAVPVDQPTSWGIAKTFVVAGFVGMFLTGGFMMLKKLSEMRPHFGYEAGGLGAFMVGASGPALDGPANKPSAAPREQENSEKPG